MKLRRRLALFAAAFCVASSGFAVALKPNAPTHYVVKEGDSMWSIANRYLKKPWEWTKISRGNAYLENPDLLVPGTVLELRRFVSGDVHLVSRGGIVKLSPRIRHEYYQYAIPPIPLQLIKPFINDSIVFNSTELTTAPYVVGLAGEHLVAANGDHIFVKGIPASCVDQDFSIFRAGDAYRDPRTNTILGYAAIHVGYARVVKNGAPSTLVLKDISESGVHVGDYLVPAHRPNSHRYFFPHEPHVPVDGQIVGMFGGITQVGSDQVIVVDRGRLDGITNGDVLSICEQGQLVRDPYKIGEKVLLPDEVTGSAMVFRTFDRVSFALVTNAIETIRLHDLVKNPVV